MEKLNPLATFLCVIFAVLFLFGTGLIVFASAFGLNNAPLEPTALFGLLPGGICFYIAYRKWLSQKADVKQVKKSQPQHKPLPERAVPVVAKLNFLAWMFAFYVFIKVYQYLFIN